MLSNLPNRAARLLLATPLLAAAVLAGGYFFAEHYLPKTQFSVGLDPYFPEDNTLRDIVDEVNEQFVNDFNIVVVYKAKDGDIFSKASLENLKALGQKIEAARLPDGDKPLITDDLVSLVTVKDVESSAMSFRTIPLVPDDVPDSPKALRQRAEANHVVRENLMSQSDKGVGAFVVRLPKDYQAEDGTTKPFADPHRAAAVAVVRGVVAEHDAAMGGAATYWFTGKPVLDADETAIIFRDLGVLIPYVKWVICALLLLYLFNIISVLIAIGAAWLAMHVAHGLIPATGNLFTPTLGTLGLLMITLMGAFIVHYFSEQHKHRKAHPEEDEFETLRRTLAGILPAALVVALTTAVGFFTNSVTDIPALKSYSIICALAVLTTFVISVMAFCFTAPIRIWLRRGLERTPLRPVVRAHEWISDRGLGVSNALQNTLGRLADVHIRHPKVMLFGSLVLIGGIVVGVHRIGYGFDQLKNFHPSEPIRIATQQMEDHVGGSTEMIVSIKTGDEDRFLDPKELAKLEGLDAFFRSELGADRVLSPVDLTKHMHRGFFENDPKEYKLPATAEQTAQLYALNSDVRLYEYISPGHHWVRVVGRVPSQNSYELSQKYKKLDAYLAQHFPTREGYEATAAGQHRVYAAMTESITESLSKSLILAFIIIFGLICVFFRSANVGLLSIPPNIMPVVLNLGLMGWIGIRLSAENAIFATICVGIAVDDTVHFLQHLRGRIAAHGSVEQAIRDTLKFKGPALIGTTLLMVGGFAVMMVSSYQQIINFGFIVSCGVGAALFGDLILLPAIILVTKSRLGVTDPATRPLPKARAFESHPGRAVTEH